MRKITFYSTAALILASVILFSGASGGKTSREAVSARVIGISADDKELTINRGSADNIEEGLECVIRYNRGDGYAQIEWDIDIARGTIKKTFPDTSSVAVTMMIDTVLVGDYCEVQADIPSSLVSEDLGRIALFDISFLDYYNGEPFFLLKDLIDDPSKTNFDHIYRLLLDEVHRFSDDVDVWSDGKIVKGGIFDGLSWGEAFTKTTIDEIKNYIEYVSYYPGDYINYDWTFIETYSTWVINQTRSGEPEKKRILASPYADRGDRLVKKGEYQKAVEAYKKALDILPDFTRAVKGVDRINSMLKHKKMLQEDPRDVIAKFELGNEYYEIDLYKEALTEYTGARELGYDTFDLNKYIGYTYTAMGRYGEARKVFEDLLVRDPDNKNITMWLTYTKAREEQKGTPRGEAYITTGNLWYEWEDYDEAISEYKKALELEPDNEKVWKLIIATTKRRKAYQYQKWALDYWESGDFEQAKTWWRNAVSLCTEIHDNAGRIDILDEMADKMFDWNFYDSAIDIYTQILDIDSGHYDSYISLSNCYKEKKDYTKALDWVEKGITINPEDGWGYNIRGYIYLKRSLIDKAIESFLKAVDCDPDYKYPLRNLGTAYAIKGDYSESRKYLRQSLEIDKDYWEARNDLIDIECLLETKQLLDMNSNNVGARLRLGRALYGLEDYGQSIIELNRVIKLKRNDPVALAYLGYSYCRLGKYEQAKTYIEKAFGIRKNYNLNAWIAYIDAQILLEKNPDDPAVYRKLGENDLYWEYFDDALTDFERAVQKGADPDSVFKLMETARKGKEAKHLYSISGDFYNRAEYEHSLEYAQLARSAYREVGAKEGEIWCLLRMGWCHANMFNHTDALSCYKQAGILADEAGNETLVAHYLSSLGDYYKSIGDFDNTMDYKQRAQEIYHSNNDLSNEAAMTLVPLGSTFGLLGETELMFEYYERALSIHQKIMNSSGEATTLSEIGSAYVDSGDYSKGLDFKLKALTKARADDDHVNELWSYRGIGDIYFDLGDGDNALKAFRHFLDTATALGNKSERSVALNDIGRVHLEFTKDYNKALECFTESLTIARLIGYTLLDGVATSNIGVTYSRQHDYKRALAFHDEGLAIVRSLNNKYTEMQGLNEKGETLQKMKRYDDALACHLSAIEIATSLGNNSEKWKYQLNAGIDYESKKNSGKAIEYYLAAVDTLSAIKNRITSDTQKKGFSEQERQINVYKRLIEALIKGDRQEEAFKYIEESKSKIIKDAFGEVKPKAFDATLKETLVNVDKYEKKKDAIEKKLQEEKGKPVEEQDKVKIRILSNTLATTEGEFNQWMLKLKVQNRKMYDALTITPTTLADIQKDIPAGSLILEYFISDNGLYIFCIGKDYFFAKSVEIETAVLERSVLDYLRLCQKPHSPRMNDLVKEGKKLYTVLIKPVEKEMEMFENIVIVPFGILYYLPFHALITDECTDPHYLVETKRVSYTTSATFTDMLKADKRKLKNILALGNPDGSLPAASKEIEMLKKEVFTTNAVILTKSEATKEKFFMYAKNYDIIHLATHGVILNNPLESYLLFAGKTNEEKRLTLLEVAGYTALREKTGLVFLSACQTAMDTSGGNGSELLSLAEAFAMAGPPTLIATLWEVDDVSTSEFVISFYRELNDVDNDKLDALRTAQLMLLRDKRYSHPFYWAPFIMIGNWR
ncbi:MAG: tetratricopeptide repeat protein [Spirochaetales bacterium]|nr:tetratricopeptide repeat protein [Spirochaetales bacterium]